MNKNRFHVKYDSSLEHRMNLYKKKCSIRFFKNLDGQGPGWSIPCIYKNLVFEKEEDISSDKETIMEEEEAKSIIETDIDDLLYKVDKSTQTSNQDLKLDRKYIRDISCEVKHFFNQILNS